MSSIARNYLNQLNADYLRVHRRKEDLFWSTYMGTSDDQAGFTAAEQAYKAFCADPARLPALREVLAQAEGADLKRGLAGWAAFFECNVIEDPAAAALMDELVAAEADLFARRKGLKLTLLDEQGQQVAGSLPAASTALAASADEAVRQSALAMFHRLEQWVVGNGFLEVVALRNRFARAMGYNDYFDYKVHKNEQMSPEQLFAVLDDFIARTEQRVHQSLAELKAAKGEVALLPHNLRYSVSGDVTRQLDPYVPFSRALKDWVESFRRLGIQYRGATLTLDLLTREGKYENGFCHGPVPSFWQEGEWVPAVVNFTSLANPAQVGKQWLRIPKQRYSLQASYRPNARWLLGAAWRWSGRMYNTELNIDTNPDTYGGTSRVNQLDLKAAWKFAKHWEWSLGINNVTNQKSWQAHTLPQRSVQTELRYAMQ